MSLCASGTREKTLLVLVEGSLATEESIGKNSSKKDTTLGNKASTNIPEGNSPDVVGSGGARRDRLLEIEINKSSKIRK